MKMKNIPKYDFYKTKYGCELLIDVVELKYIKSYLPKKSLHTLTYYDMTLITEGEGFFRIDDTSHHVKAMDMLFSLPYQLREWDIENITNGYALIFEEEFLPSSMTLILWIIFLISGKTGIIAGCRCLQQNLNRLTL